MIPKIIHYVWLGHSTQSDIVKSCIESWKKNLSDYKFMLWNEESYDISQAPEFVQTAYNAGKWAFASDYIRLWALNKYGGVYLDTDTEVRKPLDIFLKHKLFIGTQVFSVDVSRKESKTVTNLSMGIIGSEPGHSYLVQCLNEIEKQKIKNDDGSINTKVTNYTMAEVLQRVYDFVVSDTYQELNDSIAVYPSSVFSDRLSPVSHPDPYTFHWGEMSWFEPKQRGWLFKTCWHLNLMGLYHWLERMRKHKR